MVTGLGALTPVGLDAPATWRALVGGQSGIAPITHFDASGLATRIAGEVTGFDPVETLGAKRAHRTARFSQLAIAAAREAVADAGLDVGASADRVGVAVGCAVAGTPETEHNVRALLEDGPRAVSPFYVASTILNMAACEVAIDLGAHGPVTASALACATGTYSVLEARRLILAGEADVVIAGGADAGINEAVFAGLSNMGPLSENNDDPTGASRPFDSDRDGFVFGEGAVVLVVESAEHAAARGATSYGSVAGGALTSDAFHMSAPEPRGDYASPRSASPSNAPTSPRRNSATSAPTAPRPAPTTPPSPRDPRRPRRRDRQDPRLLAEVDGRPPLGPPAPSPRWSASSAMRDGILPPTINLDQPRPRVRPRPRRPNGPQGRPDHRDRQRLRLRRPELRRRLPPLARRQVDGPKPVLQA